MWYIARPLRRRYFQALAALLFLALATPAMIGLAAHHSPANKECPQPRFTGKAPPELYNRVNPLKADRSSRRAGKELYEDLSNPSCVVCHGKDGDGRGQLSGQFDPPPRNFACAATIDGIPDGQLHWIIKNGSAGTAMPSFDYLNDEEIWQLVIYLRSMTDHEN